MSSSTPLLAVDELSVVFGGRGSDEVRAVDGVSFTLEEGRVTGLVGESGCGKSVTSLALMGLLPERGVKVGGSAVMRLPEGPVDLLKLSQRRMRDLRGSRLAMIFQDPLSSLNPVVPIGRQVTEILKRHRGMRGSAAEKEAAELLNRVGIPDPNRRLREYPHQLSGGMRQRALIAMAVACRPRVMIADEPTTALDVTTQAQILELLQELNRDLGISIVLATHDLDVIADVADKLVVMYAGAVSEEGPTQQVMARPEHPYTWSLLQAAPGRHPGERLRAIEGRPPSPLSVITGCPFAPRCEHRRDVCETAPLTPVPVSDLPGRRSSCVRVTAQSARSTERTSG